MAIDPLPLVPQPQEREPSRFLRDYAPRDAYAASSVDASVIPPRSLRVYGYVPSLPDTGAWSSTQSSRSPSPFPPTTSPGSGSTESGYIKLNEGTTLTTLAEWTNGVVTDGAATTIQVRSFTVCDSGSPVTVKFLTLTGT